MKEEQKCVKAVKIGFLGDSPVGKTSVCKSFAGYEFSEEEIATIGSDRFEKKVTLKNGKEIKVIVRDTAGQERFRSAALKALIGCQGIVLIFRVTEKKSFLNIENWYNDVQENFDNPSVVIFGNMIDKNKEEWEVTSEEAKEFAKKMNLPYFETSAKTKQGIDEGFSYIIEEAYHVAEKRLNKEITIPRNNNNNNSGCPGNKKKINK